MLVFALFGEYFQVLSSDFMLDTGSNPLIKKSSIEDVVQMKRDVDSVLPASEKL